MGTVVSVNKRDGFMKPLICTVLRSTRDLAGVPARAGLTGHATHARGAYEILLGAELAARNKRAASEEKS